MSEKVYTELVDQYLVGVGGCVFAERPDQVRRTAGSGDCFADSGNLKCSAEAAPDATRAAAPPCDAWIVHSGNKCSPALRGRCATSSPLFSGKLFRSVLGSADHQYRFADSEHADWHGNVAGEDRARQISLRPERKRRRQWTSDRYLAPRRVK